MIVVGIDTNSYGYHAVATEPIDMPGARRSEIGWFQARTGDAVDRRHQIFISARDWFATLPAGTRVIVEEPVMMRKNIETTRKLMFVGGIVEAAFFQADPDAYLGWADVAAWRKVILGKGSGSKAEMKGLARKWVEEKCPNLLGRMSAHFEREPDLYDAACICEYGVREMS